jgi:hypothetical protein
MSKLLITFAILILATISAVCATEINPYHCIDYPIEKSDILLIHSTWSCNQNYLELMEFADEYDAHSYVYMVRVYGMNSKVIEKTNITIGTNLVLYEETLTSLNTSEYYYIWNCNNRSYAIYSDYKPVVDVVTRNMITDFCEGDKFSTPHYMYKPLLSESTGSDCIYYLGRTDRNSTDVLIREGDPSFVDGVLNLFIEEKELDSVGWEKIGDIEYNKFENKVFGYKYYYAAGSACSLMITDFSDTNESRSIIASIKPNATFGTESDYNTLAIVVIILVAAISFLYYLGKRKPGYSVPETEIKKYNLKPWKLDKTWKRSIYYLGFLVLPSIWFMLIYALMYFWESKNPIFKKISRVTPGTEIVTSSQKFLYFMGWFYITMFTLGFILVFLFT